MYRCGNEMVLCLKLLQYIAHQLHWNIFCVVRCYRYYNRYLFFLNQLVYHNLGNYSYQYVVYLIT